MLRPLALFQIDRDDSRRSSNETRSNQAKTHSPQLNVSEPLSSQENLSLGSDRVNIFSEWPDRFCDSAVENER